MVDALVSSCIVDALVGRTCWCLPVALACSVLVVG